MNASRLFTFLPIKRIFPAAALASAIACMGTAGLTQTGAIMIAPMPGAIPLKPGSGTFPMPGIVAEIVDLKGNPVPDGKVI